MMMKLIKRSALILLSLIAQHVMAQNEFDVLRYSEQEISGTAKFTSMAGALGALGGDATAMSYNPAGLAIYRKAEFTFTPLFYQNNSSATYNKSTNNDLKAGLDIGNLGIVGNTSENTGRWMNVNYGFNITRTANFRENIFLQGTSEGNSLIDQYLTEANAVGADNDLENNLSAGAYGAFWTYLIDTAGGAFYSYSPIQNALQTKSIKTKGRMGEYAFSVGGNYNDRLYLGATIGYTVVKFTSRVEYLEFDQDSSSEVNYFEQTEDLLVSGRGINAKLGVIYKANKWLRLGAALHSPTKYYLHDYSEAAFASYYDGIETPWEKEPIPLEYDYKILTPYKANVSTAILFGKKGLISADFEFIDYSFGNLKSNNYSFSDANDIVQDYFKPAFNLRVGAEWRIHNFSLRGGYASYGSPDDLTSGTTTYTGGFGWREKDYFVDFAYCMSQLSEKHLLYSTVSSDAKISSTRHRGLITVGLNF